MQKRRVYKLTIAESHPEVAKEWDFEKNGSSLPTEVTFGSNKYVWWRCVKGHSYEARINHRTAGSRCPYCYGHKKLSEERSLAYKRPDLAKEFHPKKNGILKSSKIHCSSRQNVWWICSVDPQHEWLSTVDNRNKGNGCPYCKNRGGKIAKGKSLGDLYKDIISEWDYEKNKKSPYEYAPFSNEKVFWCCIKNKQHKWSATIAHRVGGTGCPFCTGNKVSQSNNLVQMFPDIAAQWHPTKNGDLIPANVTWGSSRKVWWQCSKEWKHVWQASVWNRTKGKTGCPECQSGWTVDKIRLFVASILPYYQSMTEAELYVLFQQNGLLDIANCARGKAFVQALKTGKFPQEELEKHVNKEPSLVDKFVQNPNHTLEAEEDLLDVTHTISEEDLDSTSDEPTVIETKDVLAALDSKIYANLDKEAIDFFIKSAVAKIWRHAYKDEAIAIEQLKQYSGDGIYPQEVRRLFLQDYEGAKRLEIPAGYSFPYLPSLMQRYTAYLVKSRKRIGNWSGTGAGKTLSAILASRIIEAKLTVICCPNNVIDHWITDIKATYPDSLVYSKSGGITKIKSQLNHNYLVLNYKFFERPKAKQELEDLLSQQAVDFVVVDEIHWSKKRYIKQLGIRRELISWFLSVASASNSDLHVLGMSATPVINNLLEGKTLIELVTGVSHDEMGTTSTVSNCISMYQKFIMHGIRWVPDYKYKMHEITLDVDCSQYLPAIKQCHTSILDLEGILTKAKITSILQNLKPKTLIYTHYVTGIVHNLQQAIEQRGWRVAIFTGEHKDGLNAFIQGDADVLIASSCIGTGVDGLQKVCNRLIINCLPWTHAEYKQLIGRIYRQGQAKGHVDVIIPITHAQVNGQRWSWCDSRWKRIQFKKSISDAAVDGVIPEGHLRSPAQAHKDVMAWLERLGRGEVYEVERQKIMPEVTNIVSATAIRRIGDLSRMNQGINKVTSQETHQRFLNNPQEWHDYHATYRETRKDWEVVPYQEAIKWCKARPHMVVGDFGCGEAFLSQELDNKVYSFDHVAKNENVIACDMARVPLDDASLGAVIFSLSLMGRNYVDYLREANRCLKLDGHLWIAEPTSRIKDIGLFKELLDRLGFDVRCDRKAGKFSFVEALKSEREINTIVVQSILDKHILE